MKLMISNIHFEEGINSSFEPEIDLKSHVEEVGFQWDLEDLDQWFSTFPSPDIPNIPQECDLSSRQK